MSAMCVRYVCKMRCQTQPSVGAAADLEPEKMLVRLAQDRLSRHHHLQPICNVRDICSFLNHVRQHATPRRQVQIWSRCRRSWGNQA